MRLRVGPLPASQVVTAALICTGRTIGIRTCGGAGQIARLRLLPRAWRLAIGVCMARRRQGLPVGAVHGRGRANASPDGVCAGTKACVCAETGVKMQSWLNLRQLEHRPSSVASKPEQRIWDG